MGKKEKQYIDKFIDAENNQYNPRYYTGGNFSLDITDPTKPKWIGIIGYFIPGMMCFIMALFILLIPIINKNMIWRLSNRLPGIILFFSISVFFFWICFRYIKKDSQKRIGIKKQGEKRKSRK